MYDVAVIGGGPAGLTAGLVLSRSRRKVIVIDGGNPRNLKSHGVHGYLTRDGILPSDFLSIGRDEFTSYGGEYVKTFATDVDKNADSFLVTMDNGSRIEAKKVLIATGIKDNLPPLPGIDLMYGTSAFHCPYCDGWESRDKKLVVYASGKPAYALSLSLKSWSDNVVICSDGPHRINKESKTFLEKIGIPIYTAKIKKLKGDNGRLNSVEFTNGETIEAEVLFFSAPQYQRSVLAEKLGCKMSSKGFVLFGKNQSTNIKGVFVAGDAAHDMKFVSVASAEGAKAAVAINQELQQEEIDRIKNEFT